MSALDGQKAEIPVTDPVKDSSIAMKQEPMNPVSLTIVENPIPSQNGTNGKDNAVSSPEKPIKTEAEASVAENSFIPRSLQLTPTSSAPMASPITPFAPNLGTLSSQLTPEEQTAAYKKANILALSALAKRGGPNTKDMFAVQQKLQEFLTSLITLAGQKGPQLKVTVQMLVQNLVTGQLSEDEFATRIESDLHSQHQPSLLPFLKNSVPHLKKRLQLQQAIMKEIIQRAIAEKKNSSTTTSTSNSSPAPGPSPSTSTISVTNTLETANAHKATPSTAASVSQPVAAVHVEPLTSSSVSLVTKPATVVGSKVNVGGTMADTVSIQANFPQAFSQAALENLSLQLPKMLRDKISKLPPEQQKFIYFRQLKQMQQLKEQQTKKQGVASPKVVLEKQNQLVKEQQKPLVLGVGKPGTSARTGTPAAGAGSSAKKSNFATMRVIPGSGGVSVSATPLSVASGSVKRKGKGKDSGGVEADEDEEVVGMDLLDDVGVNLQEETAQFLPSTVVDTSTARSCKDVIFLNLPRLKQKLEAIMRVNGIQEVGEDLLVVLSHATQERMRDVVEKLTEISQHRVQALKDDSNYKVVSEVRSQLRVLETIDRIVSKRKQEREHEQMLKAAKSRSKGVDPEKTAKIREEAKQIQQDEAARIRNESANRTALAAIGRKRPLPPSSSDDSGMGGASSSNMSVESGHSSVATSSLFAPLASTRAPKRHVTSRDLLFYMEQERETRKSLALYKALFK